MSSVEEILTVSLFGEESEELDEAFLHKQFDAVGVSAEILQIHKRLTDTGLL